MSVPRFLSARLDLYTLSATSIDASYPLSNLQTFFAADQWRSNSTGSNQSLIIDFGSARGCDFIVIENHNFPSSYTEGAFSVQGADDSGFTTNVFTAVNDISTDISPSYHSFTLTTKRYWRIFFGAYALNAPPQLGNFFIGNALDFTTDYEYPYRTADPEYQTTKVRTLSGALRTAQAYGGIRSFEFQFKLQSDTFRAAYVAWLQDVRGDLRPFYFLDTDGYTLWYVHLVKGANPVDVIRYGLNDPVKIRLETQLASW